MFNKLKNKTILITGGTGFFGKVLIDFFFNLNEEHNLNLQLIVTARSVLKDDRIKFLAHDIKEPLVIDEKIDFIIHAATPVANDASSPDHLLEVIVNGTQNVLNFAHENKITKLINISSGAVYGTQPKELSKLDESYASKVSVYEPTNIYGSGKRIAENLVTKFCREHGISYLTLRCFAFSGEYLPQNAQFAIGNFVRDAKKDGVIKIKGDGSAIRSYLDSNDMAEWVLAALLSDETDKNYNLGSEHEVTILQLAEIIAGLIPSTKIEVENKLSANIKTNRYIPDVSKIMSELGVTQKVSLKNSIEKMIKFES
ncbi:MAG: hypothetical protein CME71_12815 [Halobacteriovorax sp.]|nr:hypothetical protein [Halobacteriovorax sp.]